MAAKLAILLLVFVSEATAQSARGEKAIPNFTGREVTVTDPGTDEGGYFPKGPATVCVAGPPQRQCYTMPKEFGKSPHVTLIQLEKDMPALLFSAEGGGVSGWLIYFALLQPGSGKDLRDIFPGISVSNQSEHEFWNLPALSDAPIFATADYVSGPDEVHYGEHRYIISTYARRRSSLVDGLYYYLEDQYMTARKYDNEKANILNSEKPEILARLARAKAARQGQQRKP